METQESRELETPTKVIKRYRNRKLYDTGRSCYVTLEDIGKMIRSNEMVTIEDNKTRNDISAWTHTQIIFEAEKKASLYAPVTVLREIIKNSNGSMSSYLAKLGVFKAEDRIEGNVNAELEPSIDNLKLVLGNRMALAGEKPLPEGLNRSNNNL